MTNELPRVITKEPTQIKPIYKPINLGYQNPWK